MDSTVFQKPALLSKLKLTSNTKLLEIISLEIKLVIRNNALLTTQRKRAGKRRHFLSSLLEAAGITFLKPTCKLVRNNALLTTREKKKKN